MHCRTDVWSRAQPAAISMQRRQGEDARWFYGVQNFGILNSRVHAQGLSEPPGSLDAGVPSLQLALSAGASFYFLKNERKVATGVLPVCMKLPIIKPDPLCLLETHTTACEPAWSTQFKWSASGSSGFQRYESCYYMLSRPNYICSAPLLQHPAPLACNTYERHSSTEEHLHLPACGLQQP